MEKFIDEVLSYGVTRFEIIEKHHKNKKDAPSGTALELERYIKERKDCEVKITSIREGEEMGEHTIIACFGSEKLSITHNVYSRNAFVWGTIRDVKSLLN